jgi:predicted transcriptional regulator of viral defense system
VETTREVLRKEAFEQHGYVSRAGALRAGASPHALRLLVDRGRLERAAHGVYRDPSVPATVNDLLHLAVLWTGVDGACLSHETALAVFDLGDVNPDRIHVTVPKSHYRIRRQGAEGYQIHYEDLRPEQIGWFDQIPTVTPATAIAQCITYGTPSYLLRQALDAGRRTGRLTAAQVRTLRTELSRRDER